MILLAAGQGKRMGASRNKIFLHLLGKPVITYSLEVFFSDRACKHIVLVTQEEEKSAIMHMLKKMKTKRKCPVTVVCGGNERQYSVYNGLKAVRSLKNIVMIHDGARPFVTLEQLRNLHQKVQETKAAILGVPVKDTIKKVENGRVRETVPRETLWQIQTPQVFYGDSLMDVHEQAKKEDYLGTDDASLFEKYSDIAISMILGSYENIKLTTPEDMLIGEAIVKRRRN